MPRLEASIEINVSRADVFKFCHDLSAWPDWDERVLQVELLTPKPLRRGTLLRIDARHGGSIFTWEGEMAEYQMPQGSKLQVLDVAPTSPFAKGSEQSWSFESVGTATRVTWVWDYKPYGVVASLLDKLGRRAATQRAIQRSLEKLKVALESGRRARVG